MRNAYVIILIIMNVLDVEYDLKMDKNHMK